MKLSTQDAELFFKLMFSLQFFVKKRLQLLLHITTMEEYTACPSSEKFQVRKSLFDQPELIDSFVSENPLQFPEEHLQHIRPWKNAVIGKFYVERILKRHTIFIAPDDTVFGVVGLHNDFDDLFQKNDLPRMVDAILLPFKGKIVYDGLLQEYSIFFGGNIRQNLKEIYLTAKQNGRIVEHLGPRIHSPVQTQPALPPQKDWSSELDVLAGKAKKLRGGSGQPAVNSPAFSLIKASLEFGQLAVADPHDRDQLWKSYDKIEKAVRKLWSILDRMD